MKKPYEQGYYDGYQDCKHFYEQLLLESERNKKFYKNQKESLEMALNYMKREKVENEKIITLGKAVKTLIEENKK